MIGLLDREKLGRVLGLLGSGYDGEVVAAGRAADAMVRRAGLTWGEALTPLDGVPMVRREGVEADAAIDACLAAPHLLTAWEIQFLRDLRRRQRYALSRRQGAALGQILAKVRMGRAAA